MARRFFTDVALSGELSWEVRGDTNATGTIASLQTSGVSSMYFSGAAPSLAGLNNPDDEREKLMFLFYGGSGTLTLLHESTQATTEQGRLSLPYNSSVKVYPGEACILFYDSVAKRWKFLGKSTTYIPDIISTGEARVNELKVTSSLTPLASGAVDNLNVEEQSFLRLTNVTSVSGFVANSTDNGKLLYVHNANTSNLLLLNNSSSSLEAHRVLTGSGTDNVVPPGSAVCLQYDNTSQKWRLLGPTVAPGLYNYGNVSSSTNVDLSLGGTLSYFTHTNASPSTLTLTGGVVGRSYKLYGNSNGVQYNFTASTLRWPSGVNPLVSQSGKTDLWVFDCVGVNKYVGSYYQNYTTSDLF